MEATDFSKKLSSSASAAAHRIRRDSASAQIHEALRERIVSLELTPGQYLSRSELAAEYGVSQTPVRDAMMKLEEEGLLVIYPQSKTEVSKIDVAHAQLTQFLRLSIELEVTRRLAQAADSANIAKARTFLSMQKAVRKSGDLEQFVTLDRSFHHSLYDAAGVADLWDIVTARSGHIDRLRNLNLPDPGKSSSILSCHTRILDAIERGDVPGVEAVVREHLSGTLSQLPSIMERNPEFF